MDSKVAVAGAIGAGVGALQTPLLREFIDRKYPTKNIPQLKGFGTPSALIGIIGGGAGLAIGAIGISKKAGVQRMKDVYVEPAIDYGITSLIGGLFSGLYPAVTEADCVAAGGYYYDGACHTTPATGAVSMQGAPMVQSAYRPLASTQAPEANALRHMSTEIQRLSAENQQLRSMTGALPPNTVSSRQAEYGFMAGGPLTPRPGSMFVPGQPTRAAAEAGFMATPEGIAPRGMFIPGQPTRRAGGYGFMDGGSTPVAEVQQMKSRFDFMG